MSKNTLVIFLILALLSVGFYAAFLKRLLFSTKKKLNATMHQNLEISNFLTIFSKSLKTVEEVENSLNLTARYVADLAGVSSLCIFTLEEDGYLKASGITGAFPPLHKSTGYVLTKPKYIL